VSRADQLEVVNVNGVGPHKLQTYVDEYVFRYNNRDAIGRGVFDALLSRVEKASHRGYFLTVLATFHSPRVGTGIWSADLAPVSARARRPN
jgi:hypothetical protein